jgi:hypothetical protein
MSNEEELIGPQPVLLLPRSDGALTTFAGAVLAAITGDPDFASLSGLAQTLAKDLKDYQDAQVAAKGGGKAKAKARSKAKAKVREDLGHIKDGVLGLAEQQVGAPARTALITKAGLSVRKTTKRDKPELAAKNTDVSGNVLLDAKAVAPSAVYFFEYSVNQKDWTALPEIMQHKTTIKGLTAGQTYYFRFRATTRKGRRDYSQVVSLLVH